MADDSTASLFAPYLVNGALRAEAMGARDIIALMTALASHGLDRRVLTAA